MGATGGAAVTTRPTSNAATPGSPTLNAANPGATGPAVGTPTGVGAGSTISGPAGRAKAQGRPLGGRQRPALLHDQPFDRHLGGQQRPDAPATSTGANLNGSATTGSAPSAGSGC